MDNYTYTPYENPFEENKRPGFLTFLCVLTFIGSGLSLLSNLFSPLVAPMTLEVLKGTTWGSVPGMLDTYEQIMATPVWQFYLLAFFCATSILGAVYMLKMKKIGFHIYAISQLVQLFIGQFLIGDNFKPTLFSLFITLLFIGLYFIYYKKMTALEVEQEPLDSEQ
ncbi:MAG: hypothetical protein FWC10_10805 [Lentimicrobiaceae bacterium]|nr:hypothetical protein [Lentimicrobiaceae bacterium]